MTVTEQNFLDLLSLQISTLNERSADFQEAFVEKLKFLGAWANNRSTQNLLNRFLDDYLSQLFNHTQIEEMKKLLNNTHPNAKGFDLYWGPICVECKSNSTKGGKIGAAMKHQILIDIENLKNGKVGQPSNDKIKFMLMKDNKASREFVEKVMKKKYDNIKVIEDMQNNVYHREEIYVVFIK